MPKTALKHFAKKAGIGLDKAEHYWDKAKGIVKAEYDIGEDDSRFWALTTGIAKKMMGIKESIGFKQFLEAAVSKKPEFKVEEVADAVQILNAHCKNALWMLKNDTPLFRGEKNLASEIAKAGFVTVDTSATVRKSQNTSNYYTMIFDNHPEMKDFPKRSRSFIGSTDQHTSTGFSGYDGGGKVFRMIPYDDAKIGLCPGYDMWAINVRLYNYSKSIDMMNDVLKKANIPSNIEGLKAYANKLKAGDKETVDAFKKVFPGGDTKTFLEDLWAAYSPTRTNLQHYTTATFPEEMGKRDREVWVSGKVVLISREMWDGLRDAYSKSRK